MSQDIATRIQEVLERDYAGGDCPAAQAVSNVVDHPNLALPKDAFGIAWTHGYNFALRVVRHSIADVLGISDSPAAAGSQPTTAGDSTLTDPLVVAVGVALAGRVWDPPLPKLPVGQWAAIVSLIANCYRELDEGKRFIAEDTTFVRTFEGNEGSECA